MKALTSITLIIVTIILSGCGSNNPLNLVPAGGTVIYDGQPLADASVSFLPEDTAAGRSAAAQTDAEGRFKMTTLSSGDGALPGRYKVTVMKFAAAPDNAADATGSNKDAPPLIPIRYSSVETSGLTADIPQDGIKDIQFELTK